MIQEKHRIGNLKIFMEQVCVNIYQQESLLKLKSLEENMIMCENQFEVKKKIIINMDTL